MDSDQGRELFFDPDLEEQNQIADHILGMVARRDGEAFDPTKSPAWQRGWAGLELGAEIPLPSRVAEMLR